MQSKIVLLLGGNKLNYGIVEKFRKLCFSVYVIDWNSEPDLKGDRHYCIDIRDSRTIIQTLKSCDIWKNIIFAYSSSDAAVESVSLINKELGLYTITDAGINNAISKEKMTTQWSKLGILNRDSKCYADFDNSISILNNSFDLIIKPNQSASSRGITIVPQYSDEFELRQSFEKAKTESRDSKVIVEEFLKGEEFTVEMIGDKCGNVCVYAISKKTHSKNTINNRVAVKLHYNSRSIELQEKIAEFGIKCYKAVEFSSSFGHLELILKPNGQMSPIEIGARSSGFIASDLVDIVSGSDFLRDLMDVQINGRILKNGFHKQTDKSALYFFYDFPIGKKIKKTCCFIDFLDKSIVSHYFDRKNIIKNKPFNKINNDNERLGFEILEGEKSIFTEDYVKNCEIKMLKNMFGIKDVF